MSIGILIMTQCTVARKYRVLTSIDHKQTTSNLAQIQRLCTSMCSFFTISYTNCTREIWNQTLIGNSDLRPLCLLCLRQVNHKTPIQMPTTLNNSRLGERSWYSSNGSTCPIDFKFLLGLSASFSVADNGFLERKIFPRFDELSGLGMAHLSWGQEGRGWVREGSIGSNTCE